MESREIALIKWLTARLGHSAWVGERLLSAAEDRVIGHRPVETGHLQQAGHHPARLSPGQLQDLDRQTELDRGIREHRGTPGPAVIWGRLGHLLVLSDML